MMLKTNIGEIGFGTVDNTSFMLPAHRNQEKTIVADRSKISIRMCQLFWTFFAGGMAGYIMETIWCYFVFGGFSSRTSNLFFPFSVVWALGAMMLDLLIKGQQKAPAWQLFLKCALFCGVFEFFCGYLGEQILGVTFWDYSGMPLHLGRYVDLYICMIWGGLGMAWGKWGSDVWNSCIRKLVQGKKGRQATIVLIWFMLVSNMISGLALLRMYERGLGVSAGNRVEQVLDICFPDRVMQLYFPKMKHMDGSRIYG